MASERGNRLLRLVDRCLGIPLVRLAGLCSKKSSPPEQVERIGVLCLGCIGDMVILSGPLADLAQRFPLAQQTIFCSGANADVARMVPSASELVILPIKNTFQAIALIREHGPFDAWLDASQWPRLGALLSFAARAQHKIGFSSPGQHRHHVYDSVVPHSAQCHELENFRQLAACLGVVGQSSPYLTPVPPAGVVLPRKPYAVLHMFPGGYRSHMKMWPEENWRELVQALLSRGFSIILSGGPADHEANAHFIRSVGDNSLVNLAGSSLTVTAEVLRQATITISVNTGVMHLAAALGAPLVSLQGPTSTLRWGAVARPGRLVSLSSQRACAPCLHLGFEYACQGNSCMRDISVATVLNAVDRLFTKEPRAIQ